MIDFSNLMIDFDNKKLIRRWDSERELFYDDIVHVLQNTKDSPQVDAVMCWNAGLPNSVK